MLKLPISVSDAVFMQLFLRKGKKMDITQRADAVVISDFGEINLDMTLDCGQAFRWSRQPDGKWRGTACGRTIDITQKNSELYIYGSNEEDAQKIWADYFDLKRDYGKIITAFKNDAHVCGAIERHGTVRILNQEPWEALCSFIISACNNIPRIKGIVSRMCDNFGERLPDGSFAFPSPEVIAGKTEDELSVLRAGYRVPFILDAARAVCSGDIDLESVRELTEADARRTLMRIKGVGRKVADCTMLFSLGFSSVFPVDRHIQRACGEIYPDGLPDCFDAFYGLAQQYIFIAQLESK